MPRHPSRGQQVAKEVAAHGFHISRRAIGDPVSAADDIHIADTLGELGLFYRLSQIAFIGGSMAQHGGHNPLEAAQLDCAILPGPDMANFATVAQQLDEADARTVIQDAPTLAHAVTGLLDDEQRRRSVSDAAAEVAQSNAAVVDSVIEELKPFLDALPAGNSDARA